MFHILLVGNVTATHLHLHSSASQVLNRLLGFFGRCSTSRHKHKMPCTFLRQPAGNIETNSSGSTHDNVGRIRLQEILFLSGWMNLQYVSMFKLSPIKIIVGLHLTYLNHGIIRHFDNHLANNLSAL